MMKIRTFILGLVLCCPTLIMAQFRINGVAPAYDGLTNTFLLSIDKSHFGTSWQADVALDAASPWRSLTIDGVAAGEGFSFENIDGRASYQIEALTDEGAITATLQFTFLPIVQFKEGRFGYDYVTDEVRVLHNGAVSEGMKAKVKWRGATTNAADKHKRNYKVKFIDEQGNKQDRSFFGLRNDNSWILDAGQVDLFRMRNLIATGIWQDFATKPYYYDREPKARTATRGRMVEVFLGDQYQGIYNLCEPIDRKQMKLKKFETDGTIHGNLWKATSYGDATFWNIPAEYDNTLEKNDVWEVKYPKIEDLCPSDYSTLRNAIMFVATASDAAFNDQMAEYFDMPVLTDYYLFVQFTNCFDICGKNVYWAVYDKAVSKMLTPAMWDLDCSMGQNYTDDPLHPDYVAYDNPLYVPNNIFHRLSELNTNHFNDSVRARYAALRKDIFATQNLQQRYIDAYEAVAQSGAAAREERRWSYDTDIAGLELNLKEELDYICNWIDKRMEFLDQQLSYVPSSISKPVAEKPSAPAYTIQGTVAPAGYRGIVIRNGKKESTAGHHHMKVSTISNNNYGTKRNLYRRRTAL